MRPELVSTQERGKTRSTGSRRTLGSSRLYCVGISKKEVRPGISGNVLTDGEFLGAESLPYHGVHGLHGNTHGDGPGQHLHTQRSVECDRPLIFGEPPQASQVAFRASVHKKRTVIPKSFT